MPPLSANLQDLRNRITSAAVLVDRDTLKRVWSEIDYRIDVCRITKGVTLSICDIYLKKPWRVSLSIGVRNTMIR